MNTMTIRDKPLISELVTKLQNTYYFTKLDICWSFKNVWIKPSDEQKVVFYTNCNLFKSLVILFCMTKNNLGIF